MTDNREVLALCGYKCLALRISIERSSDVMAHTYESSGDRATTFVAVDVTMRDNCVFTHQHVQILVY